MTYLPRGIAPELLLSQVRNTMPYLFEPEVAQTPLGTFPPAQVWRNYESSPPNHLNHFEYFRLCLSAHYLTCATPVPTDVDNQIRRKLWPEKLPLEVALEMAQLVLESRRWDFTLVSNRFNYGSHQSPWKDEALSGHLGEWFTVSAAAYCALKRYRDSTAEAKRQVILHEIAEEIDRHSEIFGSLWRANDGLSCLKASASIAHNFGDLDRVLDMWELSIEDPVRLRFYKLAVAPFDPDGNLRYLGRLWVAGELYKSMIHGSSMAHENHRHFALRKPKCLRQRREFMVPTGPFFDAWGKKVAQALASADGTPTDDTLEVVEALKHGLERLPKTLGYRRSLRGISEVHPELKDLNGQSDLSQEQFEKKWNEEALKLMDDIPSRAS
jgi:hypothetical protein